MLKRRLVVGRFALSGPVQHIPTYHKGLMKTSRLSVVHHWRNASFTDVGISSVPMYQWTFLRELGLVGQVNSSIRPQMRVTELLQYRYILCIEGADVSTAFGWALASYSVPLHPYPFVYNVWYFNGLRPWVHFVPLKPDGSDLESAYWYCETHLRRCNEIALAGRQHMVRMLDVEYLSRIKREVVSLWNLEA